MCLPTVIASAELNYSEFVSRSESSKLQHLGAFNSGFAYACCYLKSSCMWIYLWNSRHDSPVRQLNLSERENGSTTRRPESQPTRGSRPKAADEATNTKDEWLARFNVWKTAGEISSLESMVRLEKKSGGDWKEDSITRIFSQCVGKTGLPCSLFRAQILYFFVLLYDMAKLLPCPYHVSYQSTYEA